MTNRLMNAFHEHKENLLVMAVAYVLYLIANMEIYDAGGMALHVALNLVIFVFFADGLVKYIRENVKFKSKRKQEKKEAL